jgi:hypothetical protein
MATSGEQGGPAGPFGQGPDGYDPQQLASISWPARLAASVFTAIAPLASLGRLLRYRF